MDSNSDVCRWIRGVSPANAVDIVVGQEVRGGRGHLGPPRRLPLVAGQTAEAHLRQRRRSEGQGVLVRQQGGLRGRRLLPQESLGRPRGAPQGEEEAEKVKQSESDHEGMTQLLSDNVSYTEPEQIAKIISSNIQGTKDCKMNRNNKQKLTISNIMTLFDQHF